MRVSGIIFALVFSLISMFMWGRLFILMLLHPVNALERIFLPLAAIVVALLAMGWIGGKIRGPRNLDGTPRAQR